jgi:hypothetical protein
MPNGLYPVWPSNDASIRIRDLYQAFGQEPRLPKLLSYRTVVKTIEEAVRRGVLAVSCKRPDGSEQWYWKSDIDMAEWDKVAEAWLPGKATLNSLNPSAILPNSLVRLWPADDAGVKLSALCSWFDGNHMYEEKLHPDYPPELRPIPKVDYKLVHQAVSKAVANGSLWLVLGNDSVFQAVPSAIQLDAEAVLFRPPQSLSAIDFLPNSSPAAWSDDPEPKTTVDTLYAAIKASRGKPWPEKIFIDNLNSALGQGFIHRVSGTGSIGSLLHDGKVHIEIKKEAPSPPPPSPMPGRKMTNTVILNPAEVQTLGEEIAQLTKALAGCDPQVEARISIKSKPDKNLNKVNEILEKIKQKWRF